MSRILKIGMIAALVLAGGAASAAGADGNRAARTALTGYQEVLPISTDGSGSFRAVVNRAGDRIDYRLSYRELSGEVLQAHIHFGQSGVNGGVMVFLCSNLGNGPVGTPACPAEGSVSGTLTADDVVGPATQGIAAGEFAEVVAAIRSGTAYANVHTQPWPGGEIRGQLPEHHHHG